MLAVKKPASLASSVGRSVARSVGWLDTEGGERKRIFIQISPAFGDAHKRSSPISEMRNAFEDALDSSHTAQRGVSTYNLPTYSYT